MRKRFTVISSVLGAVFGIYLGVLIMSKVEGVSWVAMATGTYLNLPFTELLARWIIAISAIGIWACVIVVAYIVMKEATAQIKR